VAVLRLSVDPSRVDVNVHPTKQEVRFQRAGDVFNLVCTSLRASLEGGIRAQTDSTLKPPQPDADFDRRQRVEQAIETFLAKARPEEESRPTDRHQRGPVHPSALPLARPKEALLSLIDGGRYLGQLYQTYLCFESASGLVLIDQHVAHERVLYEKLASQWAERDVAAQDLLVPLALELSPAEAAVLEERGSLLEELGLCVEPFGGLTAVVKRIPVLWEGEPVEENIRSLLATLVDLDGKAPEDEVREKALVATACKAALKAGRPMTETEALSLLEALAACLSPLVCPHGRPVVLLAERAEIERRFQVK
jgi:DNA mismatch repair protein MutL